MTTSSRIREHLRTNVVGYLALFCFAMAGTASALPGKQTVESNDIKKNAVKGKHVKEPTLDFGVVQKRVSGECGFGEAIKAVEEGGGVECGDVGGATPTGPVGGNDITGTYPDDLEIDVGVVGQLELANNAVVGGGGGDIADNTIDSVDVLNGTLTTDDVSNASLDAEDLGRVLYFNNTTVNNIVDEACGKFIGLTAPTSVAVGELALASVNVDLPDGVVLTAEVAAANTLDVSVCNLSGADYDPPNTADYRVVVLDLAAD